MEAKPPEIGVPATRLPLLPHEESTEQLDQQLCPETIGVSVFLKHHLEQLRSQSFKSSSSFGDWFINYMVENTSQPRTFSTAGDEKRNEAGA